MCEGDHGSFIFFKQVLTATVDSHPHSAPISPPLSLAALCSGNELRTMDIRVKMRFTANFQRRSQDSLLAASQHSASPL